MSPATCKNELRQFVGFLFLYTCTIIYLKSACWRDPSSIFFQPERAHQPGYSGLRILQATTFADNAVRDTPPKWNRAEPPTLCVGLPSVQRDGISYLKSTIGSLQHGLSRTERESLYFVVLLAHTDLSQHHDFQDPWLEHSVDQLPTYHDHPGRLLQAVKMESSGSHNLKAKFDYSVVLEECIKVGALYIMMLEDDVVALDGWYHRTIQALDQAVENTVELGRTSFLYLRLFYYEGLLGWNSESWPTYIFNSLAVLALEALLLSLLRSLSSTCRVLLTRPMLIIIIGICTPICISLFFAAGRSCMLPMGTGVHLMSRYACCGQGLVFPRHEVVGSLLPALQTEWNSTEATDSFIERLADEQESLRWAITPVVLQHVGGKSSHGVVRNQFGDMTANRLFNFGFETNDPIKLAREHERVLVK
ncbi:hypothetical protein BX600DRAFT_519115 [Xylariales sp. PMI_506]|nr:hypothetical protein BX600DRAFT_519115 [Xylariales sp. PMI_506]